MICIILFITNPFNNILEINKYNKCNKNVWKQLHHDIRVMITIISIVFQ